MRVSRKLIWTSTATFIMLALASTIAAPWVAKRALTHAAEARGWECQTVGGRIGLRGVWFQRVGMDVRRDATLHAELGPVCIGWSSMFGKRRVSVASGVVRLTGTFDEVRSLRRRTGDDSAAASAARDSMKFDVHHIAFEWRANEASEPILSIRDLEAENSDDRLKLHIVALNARHAAVAVEFKELNVAPGVRPSTGATAGESPLLVSAAEVLAKYESSVAQPTDATSAKLEGTDRESSPNRKSPAPLPSAKHADAFVAGKSELGSAHRLATRDTNGKKELLPLLSTWIDDIDRLRANLANSQPTSRGDVARWMEKLPTGTRFETKAFRTRIADAGQKLDLGPWLLRGERREHELRIEISQDKKGTQSALSAELTAAERLEYAKTKFSVGPITLPQLGITNGDFGLENIAATELQLDAHAEFQSKTGEVSIESKGRVSRLSIRQPFLARQTVKNIGFEWEGAGVLDSAKRQLRSEKMRLSVGPVTAQMHGMLDLGREHHVVDADFEVPLAACQDLFSVLPEGLAPQLHGWRVNGTFSTRSSVKFDSRQPSKSMVKVRLDNNCRVASVPYEVSPKRFEQPFVLEVENEQGAVEPTSFGPGTWGYVPLSAVSPYIESAVLVCEDGRFPYHDGFDREAIQNSVRENLRTGRFARGASTVSMQLAKNLYLRRDKTIARKLQEAALTMLLEQSFSKRQLLELYLNVIEFGPGLYGIGPAAKHYFETTPERLTMAQSFFLMSILPSPKQQHFGADGLVRAGRSKLLHSLMTIAQKRGHFSEAELEAGLQEQPAFRVPGNPTTLASRRLLQDPGAALDDELRLPELQDE